VSTEVVMPRMGETVDEGTVNVWHKAPGDQVTEGEPLLEIGTDKVDTDIPAPAPRARGAIPGGVGENRPGGTGRAGGGHPLTSSSLRKSEDSSRDLTIALLVRGSLTRATPRSLPALPPRAPRRTQLDSCRTAGNLPWATDKTMGGKRRFFLGPAGAPAPRYQ
jgi:2-oxoglutarate dehydrogenase E2 component (dihydrolipoamide succinyltransferase)